MKKIIYLGLCVLLAASFGCSKDEILSEQETLEKTNSNLKDSTTKSVNSAKNRSTTNLPTDGNNIYYLYLNMDLIENDYASDPTNPSFSGPFNLFYRNLMSSNFTIYHTQESTNESCGNIERWTVNLAELNLYLISLGIPEVGNNTNGDWYIIGGNTNGVGSTNTTIAGANGKPNKDTPPPPPPPVIPMWLVNTQDCFAQ
jgi:hypothetical protein